MFKLIYLYIPKRLKFYYRKIMKISIEQLMKESGVGFGTSGARGLVSAMTDRVCYLYTRAFIVHCDSHYPGKKTMAFAGDLRPSTPRIMQAIHAAITDSGFESIYLGQIPSPATALYGIENQIPTIMVTGSHIPDNRNGIKFNHPFGEITKKDESQIAALSIDFDDSLFDSYLMLKNLPPLPLKNSQAESCYISRYLNFFGHDALSGLSIGVYQHSAVGRDLLIKILEGLGAFVKPIGRSESFIPVDTEAIRPEDVAFSREQIKKCFDSIISTDGDSDRPLLSDETGEWLRGDVLGILASKELDIQGIAVPVSCNTALEKSNLFKKIIRTRIGSPFVIEAMETIAKEGLKTAGYEANGGFLLQSDISRNGKILKALPTRDAVLPIIATLIAAKTARKNISDLTLSLCPRFTMSDRLQNFSTEEGKNLVKQFSNIPFAEKIFGKLCGKIVSTDETDGFRMVFDSEEIIHLRPSGNAPELRCYVETASLKRAEELLRQCISLLETYRR